MRDTKHICFCFYAFFPRKGEGEGRKGKGEEEERSEEGAF